MIITKRACLRALLLSVSLGALSACGGGSSSSSASMTAGAASNIARDVVTDITAITPPAPIVTNELPATTAEQPARGAQEGDIVLNQTGFQTASPKTAILMRGQGAPVPWQLIAASGEVLTSGESVYFGQNQPSGHTVHHIDFSDYFFPGTDLHIQVEGKTSEPFEISSRPYAQLAKDSLTYFTQKRAGVAVDAATVPLQDPPLTRPAGHIDNALTCFAGTDERGTQWPSCGYNNDVAGGWYDAGDYGRYTINTAFAAWTLLNLYERNHVDTDFCGVDYADGTLTIPERNNGQNDLLDEVKVAINFMLNMQVDSETPIAVTLGEQPSEGPLNITLINAKDMVHHKTHGLDFPPIPFAPVEDIAEQQLYPPSTGATYSLAAIGAMCARLYKDVDPDFAQSCLSAARKAYAAAQATPNAFAYNNFNGGGPYDDTSLFDELGWAATELFITTREENFLDDLIESLGPDYGVTGVNDYFTTNMDHLGMMSLVIDARKTGVTIRPQHLEAREDLETLAANFAKQMEDSGMGLAHNLPDYFWGSNSTMMTRAIILAQAADEPTAKDFDYDKAITAHMDYILGRNPLSQSYVTGYGETAPQNPHDRFWANGADASLPKPPPGVMVGGPTNTALIDPAAMAIADSCEGQTCYVDDIGSFTTNEIAINWNASLVWVSNWLDGKAVICEP